MEETAKQGQDEMVCERDEQAIAAHRGRGRLYEILARLYRVEVDPLLLSQLKAMRFPAASGNDLMDAGYREIASYLSNTDPATLTELAVDYVRTFIGHGIDAHAAAYPFESVYTNPKRLMMQGARDEVLAIYRSEGLQKDESWEESEDHIAMELDFMKTMIDRTVESLCAGDAAESDRLVRVQNGFISDHLASWFPQMARDMRRFSKTGLYLGLADLTEGFLQVDKEFLDEYADDAEESGRVAV